MPGLGSGHLAGRDFGRSLLSQGSLGGGDSGGDKVPDIYLKDLNGAFLLDLNSFTIQQV